MSLTEHAAEIGRLYADGHSQREIAKALGVGKSTIGAAMRRHGIPARPHPVPKGDAVAYVTIHWFLIKRYPKTGICDECGTRGRTDYSLIHGRQYSRNRDDYRELCRRCHNHYDHPSVACDPVELRRRRLLAGLTQDQLGARIGLDGNVIGKLERGQGGTSPDSIERIAEGLGCAVAELGAAPCR